MPLDPVPPLDMLCVAEVCVTAYINERLRGMILKVFDRLFQKAAVSKGGAFGRPPQRAKYS